MMHHRQVYAGQRRHDDQHHREGAVRNSHREASQYHPERENAQIEPDSLPEGDLRTVLGGHMEHRLAEQRFDAGPQADEEHRPEQHGAVEQIREQLPLLQLLPVEDDVIEHRRYEEHHRRDEHPQGKAHRVVHQRQHENIDHDVDREDRRQRQ